jgi:hypothetical protein
MYKFEVLADSSGKWAGNGIVYRTVAAAEAAAIDLAWRWTSVIEWRVVPA